MIVTLFPIIYFMTNSAVELVLMKIVSPSSTNVQQIWQLHVYKLRLDLCHVQQSFEQV